MLAGIVKAKEIAVFSFEGASFKGDLKYYAPLAQLVEQLTLNQWVPGSSP